MNGPDSIVGIPPRVTEETAPFWDAAREGRLLAERCSQCGAESFPPRGMCRKCHSRDCAPFEVTGPGQVYSFTVNHQRWLPEQQVPFAVVLVEFAAHPGVRVPGRLCGCAPEEARIGMAVDIGFAPGPDGWMVPGFIVRPG